MNYVEPIRDINTLKNMCDYLYKTSERNYVLFCTGIYTGLRISDILKLKISDIKDKKFISIRETKTRKQKIIEINPVLKKVFNEYVTDKDPDDFLIKSRQGYNKAISREMAYKILNELGAKFKLHNLGTHTMRKTFGYHYYKQTGDVVTLQKIFNHSSEKITLHYIGIEQEDVNKAYRTFRYF